MQKKVNRAGGAKAVAFLKRNIYYVLMIVCVLAIGTIVTVVAVLNNQGNVDVITPPPNNDGGGDGPTINPDVPKTEFILKNPTNGAILMRFDAEKLVNDMTTGNFKTHLAVDFAGAKGSNVIAMFGGVIESVENDNYYGTTVIIDHKNGYKSVMRLIDEATVKAGQSVNQGDVIGKVGVFLFEAKTEAHIHYELYKGDIKADNIVDPIQFLPDGNK